MKKRQVGGFTLMDVVVSVGITIILMGVVTTIMLNGFKAKTKTDLLEEINRQGTGAMIEIRRNIINSLEDGVVCSGGVGNSLTVVGYDGEESQIVCNEGVNIASSSANGVINLTDDEKVVVIGCANFVDCSFDSLSGVSKVNIGFTLGVGTEEAGKSAYVNKSFDFEVTTRD